MPSVGKKKVFKIVYLISLCMQDVLCLGMPHVGKKIGFIIGFFDQSVHSGHFVFWHALISLCMHDLLCLGMPCVGNEKGFISVLLIHLTFCVWVCPVLKRKYALSLLF